MRPFLYYFINLYGPCPHVEFANSVWCQFKQSDTTEIEKFKRGQLNSLLNCKINHIGIDFFHLNLLTLKNRRLRSYVIDVFKIIHNIGLYNATVLPHLPFNTRSNTRGNSYK